MVEKIVYYDTLIFKKHLVLLFNRRDEIYFIYLIESKILLKILYNILNNT